MLFVPPEVCDKLPLHWDDWWTPHVWLAGFCVLMQMLGRTPGKIVGYLVAGVWSGVCMLADLTDPIFTPAAILHELGLWTYVLHLFGMLLPLVAMLVAGRIWKQLKPTPTGLPV